MAVEFIIFGVAIAYVVLSRVLMAKLVDKKFMKEFQEKMKEMNKRFVKATKNNDTRELERIQKLQQKEIIPGTKKMVIEQIKMFGIVIVLFTLALQVLPYLDGSKVDDLNITIGPNSIEKVRFDKEGIWAIEIIEEGRSKGKLRVKVGNGNALKDNNTYNETRYNGNFVSLDKKKYKLGDTGIISNIGNSSISLSLDRGTKPYIYLGIPFIEYVEGEYYVFILFVFIVGLIASIVESIKRKYFNNKSKNKSKE